MKEKTKKRISAKEVINKKLTSIPIFHNNNNNNYYDKNNNNNKLLRNQKSIKSLQIYYD